MDKGLYRCKNDFIRVLEVKDGQALVFNCIKNEMPKWVDHTTLTQFQMCGENDLKAYLSTTFVSIEEMDMPSKKTMYERYTTISGVLSLIADKDMRIRAIKSISNERGLTMQTIRNYTYKYLTYNDIRALAPYKYVRKNILTPDEKNIRYALNKFYYSKNKNSLTYAYRMMLKEKYCNAQGLLNEEYPSFSQFRYFYRKTKKMQTYYISRKGLKAYQRDYRPLVGDNIQAFAPNIGIGMLDATICDIYLVNEENQIIGRPVLTACVDAYSGLCNGYSLTWKGGMYSLRNLLLNILADKVEHCKKFGILIKKEEWDSDQMLGTFVTDKGSEYKSENFEQLTDLGVNIVNLPAYRPELKGAVEKFFDVIQGYYKPYLKGKGIIEPDYQERGAHDYRKDASLTLEQFETVILKCIVFYNSKRILEKFPYTEEMLQDRVKPYCNCIWNYKRNFEEANLIDVTKKELIQVLLPRTWGVFTRQGLKVNQIRYHNPNFTEKYLQGKEVLVAYNPDNTSSVYLIDNGHFIEFKLIEKRFQGKDLGEIFKMREMQKELTKMEIENKLQAEIDLAKHILTIRDNTETDIKKSTKNIRRTRKKEEIKTHNTFNDILGE